MNSPDDTFRVLSRIGFFEMEKIYTEWWQSGCYNGIDRVNFFLKYGWTWLEFVRENSRVYKTNFVI